MEVGKWWRRAHSLQHVMHTSVAAVAALALAGLITTPEAYWAPITTLVVMQSDLESTVATSARRLVGTAIGAALGALVFEYFGTALWAFGAGVLLSGLACIAIGHFDRKVFGYADRTAYRFAAITLAVVQLIPHSVGIWKIAVDRCIEGFIGIVVALVFTKLWPEPSEGNAG